MVNAVLGIICVLLACSCSTGPPARKPAKAPSATAAQSEQNPLLIKAASSFNRGAFSEAQKYYRQYLIEFPDGKDAATALMQLGNTQVRLEDYYQARLSYERLIESFPTSKLAPMAGVQVTATHYLEGNFEEAKLLLDELDISRLTPAEKIRYHLLAADIDRTVALPLDAAEHLQLAYREAGEAQKARIRKQAQPFIQHLSIAEMELLADQLEPVFPKGEILCRLATELQAEGRHFDVEVRLNQFLEQFPEHEKSEWAEATLAETVSRVEYDRYTLGCLLPLTGPFHNYGNRALKGIELALYRHNTDPGRPQVNITIRDTGGAPEQTFQAVDQLAEEKVAAIVGPMIAAEAAAFQAQQHKIPIITMTQKEAVHQIGEWIFRNFITPRMQIESVVSYATSDLGVERHAIMYPSEKYGSVYLDLFRDQVLLLGGEVTDVQPYDTSDTDFTENIKQLIREYESDDPDAKPIYDFQAIFIPDSPAKASLIVPQLAFHDISDVVLLGTNLWNSEEFIRENRQFLQGAVIPAGFFSNSQTTAVQEFVTAFRDAYGENPGFIEAIAYDSATMALDIMGREEVQSRLSFQKALKNVFAFDGATGRTSFTAEGDAEKELYLLRVKGNKLVEAAPSGMF